MFFKKHSKEDEEISKIVRRHPLTFLPQILLVSFLIALSFASLFYLPDAGIWRFVVFAIPFVAGFIYGLRVFLIGYFSGFMITSQRVAAIERKGFFSRQVSEIYLDKIQDVSYQTKGILQTLFNYGTVTIQTGGDAETKLKKISHPQRTQESIVFFQNRFKNQSGQPEKYSSSPEPRAKAAALTAEEVLAKLPPEELARLTSILDKIKNR